MKKSATSKEELLAIAKEIAGREGIGNLNIRRLASESGIAIGTVYNYYPSKGDLIGAVMEDLDVYKRQGIYTATGQQLPIR